MSERTPAVSTALLPELSPHYMLQALALRADSHVVLALSGGLDSVVLLDLLAKARKMQPFALQAVYINHGISAYAGQWGDFCAQQCQARDVLFTVRSVELHGRDNLELKARTARYQALAEFVSTDKHLLLTAHHGDDQLETLLLALKRGSGAAGLSGIAAVRGFAQGTMQRPLLPFSRSELAAYADDNKLNWVTDDSNNDLRFERNFIRHRITPLLLQRWPHLISSAGRSMQHLADLQQLADHYTEQALAQCLADNCLQLAALAGLLPLQQDLVIRRWLSGYGLNPESRWLNTLKQQVIAARVDATPVLVLADYELRRYGGKLYILKATAPEPLPQLLTWQGEPELTLPAHYGQLHFSPQPQGAALPLGVSAADVVFAKLSLRFKPAGATLHKPLKQWFKLWQVPPWQRRSIPLLLVNGEVVAVAGYASSYAPAQALYWLNWHRR